MTIAEALQALASADATEQQVRHGLTRLVGEPLSRLSAWPLGEDDVDVVTAITGKLPFPLTDDTTTLVVRLIRAIFINVFGTFDRDAILDAVLRGIGPAAGARMLELAAVNGGRP